MLITTLIVVGWVVVYLVIGVLILTVILTIDDRFFVKGEEKAIGTIILLWPMFLFLVIIISIVLGCYKIATLLAIFIRNILKL